MESPVSSEGECDGDMTPSDASTPPSPVQPFQPAFKVKVTEPIKNGETISYTVKTTVISSGEEFSVSRLYEDFEYLHHCLITSNNIHGIIVPPIVSRPVMEAKNVEAKSKKQLGSASKILIGDNFHKDCRGLERYLRMMLSHSIFGHTLSLKKFLLEKEPPLKTKVQKGFFTKISSAVEEARKANHRDMDDYFQRERDWAIDYTAKMKEVSTNFNKMVYSEQRISCAYGHLSTSLNLGGGVQDVTTAQANGILVKFSEAMDDAKHGTDVDVANDENTLGSHLDLYARYAESLKDMLYRRTCLMIEYEEANRTLDKAKPHKKTAAEEAKLAVERTFETCSDQARIELESYRKQQVLAFQDALTLYSEAKAKTARDTYALLAKSLLLFKQMQV